jgi:UDPglucose 6-dehydrogenase
MAGDAAASADPALTVMPDAYAAAEGAHCLVLCTEWPEFRDLDLTRLGALMAQRAIVDGRNLLDADVAVAAGFHYLSVGREPRGPETGS